MNIKIKFFLMISIFSFVSIKGMSLTFDEANQMLLKAAQANDHFAALEAIEAGAHLIFLGDKGFLEFTLDSMEYAGIYEKFRKEPVLLTLNKIVKNDIEKDTGLPHELSDIVLAYDNPFPTELSGLKGYSVKDLKKLIHIYDEHFKKKTHHNCVIM